MLAEVPPSGRNNRTDNVKIFDNRLPILWLGVAVTQTGGWLILNFLGVGNNAGMGSTVVKFGTITEPQQHSFTQSHNNIHSHRVTTSV